MKTLDNKVAKLEVVAQSIEAELAKVQASFRKHEAGDMPSYYKNKGFDNIVGNACFYDLIGAVAFGDKAMADKFAKDTQDYLQKCLSAIEANKPDFGGWRGFEPEAYYPLHTAVCLYKCEFMDAYREAI